MRRDRHAALFFLPESLRRDLGALSPWGRFQRRLAAADALLYEEIARRRERADLEERTDVLSLLLRARDEDGSAMTDVELRDELMTMLARRPRDDGDRARVRLRPAAAQPRACWPGCARSSARGDDAYLDAVVTETLRLRPVIDAAERTLTSAAHDRRLGAARRHPRLPGDRARPPARGPLPASRTEFRPERFLDEEAESYSWLPFGGGIRRCIGAALAQAEMAEVIRIVVTSVELRAARPQPRPGRAARDHARAQARDAGGRRAAPGPGQARGDEAALAV